MTQAENISTNMSLSKEQTDEDKSKKRLFRLSIASCQENNLDKVKACLLLKVDVNTVSKKAGLTIAAHKNYPQLLDLLLSQPGIDVNKTSTVIVTGNADNNIN